MSSIRRRRSAVVQDVGRLISPLDVLYQLGNLIYRRSLRYMLVTAGVSLVGLVMGRVSDAAGLSLRQAILLPLIVGGLALVVGSLLKVIPSLISSRLRSVAQASDLNLMEDYRKSQLDAHLERLWDRLFRHEFLGRMVAGQPFLDGPVRHPGESEADATARARARFLQRAREAIDAHLPQVTQMHIFGLDLRYLEDWRDGAYLDPSDTKLIEQFSGSPSLVAARRDVRFDRITDALRFIPRRASQRLWLLFITRSVGRQVGSAVRSLNRRFDTTLFNSQVLLWPGEERADWLACFEGATQRVLKRRRALIRGVFGPDLVAARDVLDHMLYTSVALATELRMRYDPEYCVQDMDYHVLGDLDAEGRNRQDRRRVERFVDRARRALDALRAFLEAHRPELLEPQRFFEHRAVRVAFHTNRDDLKRRVLTCPGGRDAPAEALAAIDEALADEPTVSRRLLSVRMHHEMTRIARASYHELIATLGYDG